MINLRNNYITNAKAKNKIKPIYLVIPILALLIYPLLDTAFAEAGTGSVELFIKDENEDRVIPEGLSIKVYRNLEKTPFMEIPAVTSNPFKITSLPLGVHYRFEVYMNNMYADVGYSTLDKAEDRVVVTIENLGGMRLSIFYKDAETPLVDAKVRIKSFDGQVWGYTETDSNGRTVRMWLYPTIKEGDYYSAEISPSQGIQFVHTPIKLQPGEAQEFKVVTNWPVIIDKLIKVEVYNSTKTKVTKSDGLYIAELYDIKKNKIAESPVTDKGVANFSMLKVNNYALFIKKKDSSGQLNTVAVKKATITDTTDVVKIYLNNPELNRDHLSCNCVAFRLDDIQDYYLSPAQTEVISLFKQKNAPITIGIIGGLIGTDQKLIGTIKGDLVSDNPVLEIASHSWNNRIMPSQTKNEQNDLIKKTNDKIFEVFRVTPTVFIPPENAFNNDTIAVLRQNGFTHISHAVSTAEPPAFKKSDFYQFPMAAYTAHLDTLTGYWQPISNDKILEDINDSLFNYGYAVVMMHPYEFSVFDNGYYLNKVNATKIQELGQLIDSVQAENLKILPIGSIQDYDKPIIKQEKEVEKQIPNCNCIAFRLDNVQDFWLNNVQSGIIETLDQKDVPLTIAVLGKFIGNDPKTVNTIKEKLNKTTVKVANRGWEYIDHTSFDKEKQEASIKQTNEKIRQVFGVKAATFSPPSDAFNKDTIEALKQAKMVYLSSNIVKDSPPYPDDTIRHIPSTMYFADLADDDPFLAGTLQQKAMQKIQSSINLNGFAAISMNPTDLAIKNGEYKNEPDKNKIALLESVIDGAKSKGIQIVLLERIPALLDDKSIVVPDWVKDNAGWWAEGKITDSDFTKGLEYLIEQKIIQIPSTESGTASQIPDWIKNNARWWAEGKIGNSDFVKGIQYLIENGIIKV